MWKDSILLQLQARKAREQTPFEDICSFACSLFDKVDTYKSENIQLNLQREQLQQQLLGIQQTILAGGSNAAKSILSNLSSTGLPAGEANDVATNSAMAKNLSLQHAALLNEKSQLEKKVLELQEKLADVLKSKSDTVQKVVDLKTELDEKNQQNRLLVASLDDKVQDIIRLREALEKLDIKLRTLTDEHLALTLSYKSLEKRHAALTKDFDALSLQLLAVRREDADRLNAENDRQHLLQQERARKEIELKVAELEKTSGDPGAFSRAKDAFEELDDEVGGISAPSRIPGDLEFIFDAHGGETSALYWYCRSGPKEDYLATGGIDRKVKIWKIADGANGLVATLLGSNASITAIDVEADYVLAGSNDYAARVWSVVDYKLKRTLTGHSGRVLTAKFLGEPNKAATGSHDRTMKIWDINQGACLKTYFADSSCHDLIYNNCLVFSGHFDGLARGWDLRTPTNNEPIAHVVLQSKITSTDVNKDGTKFLCSMRDDTIKCVDIRRLEVIQTYSDENFRVGSDFSRARFSADGRYITCGSNDGSIYIWDTNSSKVAKVLHGHDAPAIASCWSPDGKRMATMGRGKKVSIWL